MNSESTSTSTKGGSFCGFAACPACGFPDLPGIEPETLHQLVGIEACAGHLLPDGRLPVYAGGRVYLMPQEAWTRYKTLCASTAATERAMQQAAA
jgi:hypothetical protein